MSSKTYGTGQKDSHTSSYASIFSFFVKQTTNVRIVEIAPEGHLRHQQVVADQELDRAARVGRELEPIEHALRQLHALLHVLGVAPLDDVVEEEGQRQELGGV